MREAEVISLGCRLNRFESEVMRTHAKAAGLSDTVIVNSCAVTAEAEREARYWIRKTRRERPEARIIVCGCAAQIDPGRFAGMEEVDLVLGNEEKMRPESYRAGAALDSVQVSDIMEVREVAPHLLSGFEARTRAFVQIQQGCDHRCTFCIIPFARGPNRSVPERHILEQIRILVAEGYSEAVLTGVDISSYGRDLGEGSSLGRLVGRILDALPELARLRLSSLDPAVDDPDLMHLMGAEERLMPHLHLSIQAGSDLILKRMKRRHDRARVLALSEAWRAVCPDIALGADLIAGFPTETEEMVADGLSLIAEAGLSHLHVFPFSPRPGTPAARMAAASMEVRRQRARRLRAAGAAVMETFLENRIGAIVRVLVEKDAKGYSEHYLPVRLSAPVPQGTIVAARVTGRDGSELTAEPLIEPVA